MQFARHFHCNTTLKGGGGGGWKLNIEKTLIMYKCPNYFLSKVVVYMCVSVGVFSFQEIWFIDVDYI